MCRSNFSSILEEGLLSRIIEAKFAPNKNLYEDITNYGALGDFIKLINSLKKLT